MTRYVCVHGHFYQPPRENPWLEALEIQDSAYPYHDWNERISAECYAPNAAARILDERKRIAAIVNNYARISFDFGPTLLSWLDANAPETYSAILEADRESTERFSGHGSAIAHAYNHAILPLADERDRRTQIRWGIADFRHRFGREPEGLWLPETAVDVPTLEALADAKIAFTVLAPSQAARVRPLGEDVWRETRADDLDTTRAYRVSLPSGRAIDVFFYDGSISRDVAFGGLLHSGEQFASRLLAAAEAGEPPRLVHVATDGETYGHHHAHGDMALAYALRAIGSEGATRLTNYAEFRALHPARDEAEIRESTSWSCAHGVERWRSDCGCSSGAHPDWSQAWRAPLRDALDALRDAVARPFEEAAGRLLRDPWAARDGYVGVVLERTTSRADRFFAEHSVRPLSEPDRVAASKLLELQRHALLMFTSCGWFFDDLAGIEGLQVLRYAGRVVQLAEELFGGPFEERFREALSRARSNRPEEGDGREIYDRHVRPARVEATSVGGHYAVRSLFEPYAPAARIFCYTVEREDFRILETGKMTLGVGRARFTSEITGESARLAFGALHMGDHNVHGGVGPAPDAEAYDSSAAEVEHAFARADVPRVLRLLDPGPPRQSVSLKNLFRDEQRRILRIILESTRGEAEEVLRQLHERNLPLMRYLADAGSPLPRVLRATAEFVINAGLRRALAADALDASGVGAMLAEAARERVPLDGETLGYLLSRRLEGFARSFAERPDDPERVETLRQAVDLAARCPFPVRLWPVQNAFWRAVREAQLPAAARAERGDADAKGWIAGVAALAERLAVRLPEEPGS